MRLPARRDYRFEIGLIGWWSFIVIYRPVLFWVRIDVPMFLPNVTTKKQKSLTFRMPWRLERSVLTGFKWEIRWKRFTFLQYTCSEVWTDPEVAACWPTHQSIEFWIVKGNK